MDSMPLTPRTFNQFEVVLWIVCAGICLLHGLRNKQVRLPSLIACGAFLLFSGSDAMEITTGAWWRPWWLFVWKAACVVTLLGTAVCGYLTNRDTAIADAD